MTKVLNGDDFSTTTLTEPGARSTSDLIPIKPEHRSSLDAFGLPNWIKSEFSSQWCFGITMIFRLWPGLEVEVGVRYMNTGNTWLKFRIFKSKCMYSSVWTFNYNYYWLNSFGNNFLISFRTCSSLGSTFGSMKRTTFLW